MSINPVRHPFYMSVFVNIVTTLAVDSQRGLLEFSIGSNLWVHLLNFPFWIICIVFTSCALIRKVIDSPYAKIAWFYLWNSPKKELASDMHELSLIKPKKRRPKTVRIQTEQPVIAENVSGRDITSATPVTGRSSHFKFV